MTASFKSTGNLTVDQMQSLPVQGDVVPPELYKHVKKEGTGTTDFLAVQILSNIIYWHRPTLKYSPQGEIVDVRKKFAGDLLQKHYDDYSQMYDVSKRQVTAAFDTLEYCGFVKRIWRTVTISNGRKIPNVMFIELNVEKLREIFCVSEQDCVENIVRIEHCTQSNTCVSENGYTENVNDMSRKNVLHPTKNRDTYTNTDKDYNRYVKILPSFTDMRTEETCEGVTDESSYRTLLSEQVELDSLCAEYPEDKDRFLEYFEIMVDLVCYNTQPVRIKGRDFPAEAVKSRMLKLRREHLEYVCSVYDTYCGEIADFFKHCASTLYCSYYEVNNRMNTLRITNLYKNSITA